MLLLEYMGWQQAGLPGACLGEPAGLPQADKTTAMAAHSLGTKPDTLRSISTAVNTASPASCGARQWLCKALPGVQPLAFSASKIPWVLGQGLDLRCEPPLCKTAAGLKELAPRCTTFHIREPNRCLKCQLNVANKCIRMLPGKICQSQLAERGGAQPAANMPVFHPRAHPPAA